MHVQREGFVAVSAGRQTQQALQRLEDGVFIINNQDATAREVLDLIAYVQQTVWDRFQIQLEPEVLVVGEEPEATA